MVGDNTQETSFFVLMILTAISMMCFMMFWTVSTLEDVVHALV